MLAWGHVFGSDAFEGSALSGVNQVLQNPGWLGLAALLLVALVPKSLWFRKLRLRSWENYDLRQRVLHAVGEEIFNDRMGNVRVSILEEVGTFRNWRLRRKRDQEGEGRFLAVKQRYSGERRDHQSNTAFFQHDYDPEQSEGVAATAMSEQKTLAIEGLPDIEGLPLDKIDLDADSQVSQKVGSYMSETRINSPETLKSINRQPRHIIACPVYDDKAYPVSALVIDSMREESFLDAKTKAKIETYAKVLSQTYD